MCQNNRILRLYSFLLLFTYINCISCKDKNAREDSYLSHYQLPPKYGYPAEVHHVVTSDGYILGILRIPHGRANSGPKHKKVVLLNHGILGSSTDFIITGPKHALGYLLADAGYDVWMINNRGNTYSRRHKYLSTESAEFWNFDWHEMGIYDIPATIDYILKFTNHQKLIFIGYSQGTTAFFLFASSLPEYNSKIELQISMAPIVFTTHTRDSPLVFLYVLNQPLVTLFRILGVNDFLPESLTRTKITNAICDKDDILQPVCMSLSTFIQSTINLNTSTWIAVQAHYPAGASWKQIEHYGQIFNSGRFRQYDYGDSNNWNVYQRSSPPDYDLKKVTAPVILIEGPNDMVSVKEDIDRLEQELPNILERHMVSDQNFGHTDFIFATDAKDVVYHFILEKIKHYTG